MGLGTSRSGVIEKQERKEMCPGLGMGCMPSGHHTLWAATVPHCHWAQPAPLQMEALALLFRLLGLPVPSASPALSNRSHPYRLCSFQLCLLSELGLCLGPTPTPQPA